MKLERVKETALTLNCTFKENEILAPYTRLGIGGKSLFYIKPSKWSSVKNLFRTLIEENIPFKVMGKGTNILISDRDLNFGVVHLENFEKSVIFSGTRIEVSADTSLNILAYKCFSNNFSGLEEISLIPGTVGGGVFMNAGAFGKTIFDLIEKVTILNKFGEEKIFVRNELEIGYRRTNIKDLGIVKSVTMVLQKEDKKRIKEKTEKYKKIRDLTQPWKERTCGSVFKNPEGVAAGKILEELGYKGKRKGSVKFSEKHSNFLVAEKGAKFDDAFSLIEEARQKAREKGFDLDYEMEVWQDESN